MVISRLYRALRQLPRIQLYHRELRLGAKVAKNTQIILTISGGEDVVNTTVPSVTGETEDDAREKLEAAGFKVTVDYDYSSTVA